MIKHSPSRDHRLSYKIVIEKEQLDDVDVDCTFFLSEMVSFSNR